MKTIDGTPARAACAATELARLPVEAQAKRVKPSPRAAVSAIETTRSLNEWVGLALSSLTYSGAVKPSSAASPGAAISGRQPGVERDPGGRVLADRQQTGVPPEVLGAGFDVGAGDLGQRGRVVGDLERAETLVAGVLRGERVFGAAAATGERAGGAGSGGGRDGSSMIDVMARVLSSFPASQVARTELAPASPASSMSRASGCRGFVGPYPSAPLDEVFSCAASVTDAWRARLS